MQFNVMASAESVVSEQNPLNKRSDLKDLKFINPESWPVVMCGSSQRDRWPHRARAAVPNSTPGTHTFNANSARNQQLRGTECGVWGLGAGLPLPTGRKSSSRRSARARPMCFDYAIAVEGHSRRRHHSQCRVSNDYVCSESPCMGLAYRLRDL